MAHFSKPGGLLSLLFAVVLLVQASVAAHHHQHAAHHDVQPVARNDKAMAAHLEETRRELQKRANNVWIMGVPTMWSGLGTRKEIRELKKNADQWNLYLLGMERFQAKSHSDRLSYYQIAGIHGKPYISWNPANTALVNRNGYCPHAQTLFGSWHRPYLAIFEQAWYQSLWEIIPTFPASQQQRWKNAAQGLRMPYWDWAQTPANGQPVVPTTMRDQYVTVTKPQGQVSIPNPLYSYKWGNSMPAEMEGGPWNNFPSTLRRPISNPTRSNNNEVNTRFTSMRTSLRDRVYGLFMAAGSGASWGSVSTSAIGVRTSQNGNNPDSFESVHDAVHVTAGGESGGHMYYLDYSSFDPIFWLHHTNVDRLLAMYQVLSPNTWVTTGNINRPMAQWNVGESKNANSPLKPFTKNTDGDFYTSNDVKRTQVFNYVYPENAGNPTAAGVRSTINRLYAPNAGPVNKRDIASGQYEGRKFKKGDYNVVLSIVANKYALAGSYSVHCFLGSPSNSTNTTVPYPANSTVPYPTNSTSPSTNGTSDYDFTLDPNYVGMYGVTGHSGGHMGGNDSYPVLTEGCLPLTTALQGKEAYGELNSLHPDEVEPYLKNHLQYKIIGPGGVELAAESLPDLHIYVKACPVTPANSDEDLPVPEKYVVLPEATENKPAGKPYKYTPQPYDYTPTPSNPDSPDYSEYPEGPEESGKPHMPTSPYETSAPYPTGSMPYPWKAPDAENGYCLSETFIQYVDEEGNALYVEKSD
ncbi:Di-copper centre-containing protein [Amniculicola lignicola CBS 123094]|uniref:tyrosinase n=1 Tax=Amniculicola lignicola CBS 123094 TaxID=1392246 RepID=A0A6A5W1H6_9PLEO|nr:Di-copper centre-containing protein [Amniculicola lignicola CBS 123094]